MVRGGWSEEADGDVLTSVVPMLGCCLWTRITPFEVYAQRSYNLVFFLCLCCFACDHPSQAGERQLDVLEEAALAVMFETVAAKAFGVRDLHWHHELHALLHILEAVAAECLLPVHALLDRSKSRRLAANAEMGRFL